MKIVEVGTTACSTLFEVTHNGVTRRVRLWAITGGQLALALDAAPFFQERKNICDLYTDDKCFPGTGINFRHYLHQDPKKPIGPRIFNLNYGYLCFRQFIVKAWDYASLYDKRAAIMTEAMGDKRMISTGRLHHKRNREYFKVTFEPFDGGCWRTSPVCYKSTQVSGPFGGDDIGYYSYYNYMSNNWIVFTEHVDAIIRVCKQRTGNSPWRLNDLNDEEFAQYVGAIRKVQGKVS